MQNQFGAKLYGYSIPPIDFGWELTPTVESLIERLRETLTRIDVNRNYEFEEGGEGTDITTYDGVYDIATLLRHFKEAQTCARRTGWQGDNAEKPGYFTIPDQDEFWVGFVFKQCKSGRTYVVSPIPFPHLEEYLGYTGCV
ncbi:hypothetical protein ACR8TE_004698 [Salmonella enterica]|nr:hypothetical protein [Salmonella enterica subsp. enterica]